MQRFITVIPLQIAGQLRRYRYQAVGNTRLAMEEETSFPILTAINGYASQEEPFEAIAVTADTEDCRRNLEALRAELDALCLRRGLRCAGVREVPAPSGEEVANHVALFQRLIDCVEDDDELFACITFGTKPLSMAVRMAVQYAYRVKRNVSIPCIVYGSITRSGSDASGWTASVYDETALIRLDEIVRMLAERGVEHPRETIDRILEL